jgi:hypothetical protein
MKNSVKMASLAIVAISTIHAAQASDAIGPGATLTRSSYKGDSTVNFFAGVRARYEINDKWDLNLQTGTTHFGSGITDSSIVEEESAYYGSVSLDYNF